MVEIVNYRPDLVEPAVQLILDIQQNEMDLPVTRGMQDDLVDVEAYYLKPGGNFWLAVDGQRVVGTIGLVNFSQGVGVLRKMFVHQEFRGKQYATAKRLFDTLVAWSLSKQFNIIYLATIEKLKAAQRFYEKSGFSKIPESELPDGFHDTEVNVSDPAFYYRMELRAHA